MVLSAKKDCPKAVKFVVLKPFARVSGSEKGIGNLVVVVGIPGGRYLIIRDARPRVASSVTRFVITEARAIEVLGSYWYRAIDAKS